MRLTPLAQGDVLRKIALHATHWPSVAGAGAGMRKRWLVDLSDEERADLEALARRGKAPAHKVAHARAAVGV
jgi:hypothetical protein